jgi:hypothetical protein
MLPSLVLKKKIPSKPVHQPYTITWYHNQSDPSPNNSLRHWLSLFIYDMILCSNRKTGRWNSKYFSQEAAEQAGIRTKYIPYISQHVTTMKTYWFQPPLNETQDKDYISLAYNKSEWFPLSWDALLSTFLQKYKSTALVKEGFLCGKSFVFLVLWMLVQLHFNHCPGRKHCR